MKTVVHCKGGGVFYDLKVSVKVYLVCHCGSWFPVAPNQNYICTCGCEYEMLPTSLKTDFAIRKDLPEGMMVDEDPCPKMTPPKRPRRIDRKVMKVVTVKEPW